MQTAIYE